MIQLARVSVERVDWGCVSTFDDGASWGAHPHPADHHYNVIAHRCGYGEDLMAYAVEHEVCHHLLADELGSGVSPVIWALAHGQAPDTNAAAIEEIAVHALQRWIRANERPIVGEVDWDAIKARARALLG